MNVTGPVTHSNGTASGGDKVSRDLFHSGNDPGKTGGVGSGEVAQGHLDEDNFDFDEIPRALVRRRTFHPTPAFGGCGLNVDYWEDFFPGISIDGQNDHTVRAIPVVGGGCTWHNRTDLRGIRISFGVTVVIGKEEAVDPTDIYTNLSGDWPIGGWIGLFLGGPDDGVFLGGGADQHFPYGQLQARDLTVDAVNSVHPDYTDIRTWTDRIVLRQADLDDLLPSLADAINPLKAGNRSLGLRVVGSERVVRVKRAYCHVQPCR